MPSLPVVIRLPRTCYLVVLFLLVGAIAVGFGDDHPHSLQNTTAQTAFGGVQVGPRTLVLLVPLLALLYVARTATIVTEDGLRVRALFGSRTLPWTSIRGLSVGNRSIYAVQTDGAVRLPCVRVAHLGPISRLSGGFLPELPDATPKPAPSRRSRR